jgi:phosphatidylglycerol:prolipoprotein diacylglycerol transferase
MAPVLIESGAFSMSSYSFFVFLGAAVIFFSGLFLSVKSGLPVMEIASFLFFGLAAAVIGAKIYLWIILTLQGVSVTGNSFLGLFIIPKGEGGYLGALSAGALFAVFYSRRYRLPFWELGDHVAPGLAAGYAVMKIGCFLSGCCLGTPSSLPWAVHFPFQNYSVHPVQLYESGLALVLAVILYRKHGREKWKYGRLIGLFLIVFSFVRILTTFFRSQPLPEFFINQVSFLAALGMGIWVLTSRKMSS